MDPLQALAILDQIAQPGKQFTRQDYVLAAQALQVIAEALKPKASDQGFLLSKAEPKTPEVVP